MLLYFHICGYQWIFNMECSSWEIKHFSAIYMCGYMNDSCESLSRCELKDFYFFVRDRHDVSKLTENKKLSRSGMEEKLEFHVRSTWLKSLSCFSHGLCYVMWALSQKNVLSYFLSLYGMRCTFPSRLQ